MLLYVLFLDMCMVAASVRGGFVWACIYGAGCWWGCAVSVLLM